MIEFNNFNIYTMCETSNILLIGDEDSGNLWSLFVIR